MTTNHAPGQISAASQYRQMVDLECSLLQGRYRLALRMTQTLLVALAVSSPVIIYGDNRTVGAWGGLVAFEQAAQLGVIAIPALILASLGRDFDSLTREVRFLGGTRLLALSVAQCVSANVVWFRAALWTSAAALIAGTLDQIIRIGIGEPSRVDVDLSGTAVETLKWAAVAIASGISVWLVVLACRSGRRAFSVILVATLTLIVPLLRIDGPARSYLGIHPVALPWSIVNPFPAETLNVSSGPLMYVTAALGAATVASFAARGVRRPR